MTSPYDPPRSLLVEQSAKHRALSSRTIKIVLAVYAAMSVACVCTCLYAAVYGMPKLGPYAGPRDVFERQPPIASELVRSCVFLVLTAVFVRWLYVAFGFARARAAVSLLVPTTLAFTVIVAMNVVVKCIPAIRGASFLLRAATSVAYLLVAIAAYWAVSRATRALTSIAPLQSNE